MNDRFYEGASDALHAMFEPKTPCRNMETRPCVILTHDDRQRFPKKECLPHYCSRFNDHYEVGQIPHQLALDEPSARGAIEAQAKNFDMGDIHDGPYCVRCKRYECRNCNPKVYTEPCSNQDPNLF